MEKIAIQRTIEYGRLCRNSPAGLSVHCIHRVRICGSLYVELYLCLVPYSGQLYITIQKSAHSVILCR